MILKNDGVTLITAVERIVQEKKDSRQPDFPNTVDSLYKSC